jgi:hypothetical protein
MAALLVASLPVSADISVSSGSVSERDGAYYLDAGLDVELTPVARNALREGVPLVIAVRLRVVRLRSWWPWDAAMVESERRYRLRYSALAERYRLTDLAAREHRSFASLREMLSAFDDLPPLRAISAGLLESGQRYQVRLRAVLDLDSLPRPMRTLAYISPGWWLASDWYAWRLAP